MLTRGGTEWQPTDLEIACWRVAYPDVDVDAELRLMEQWCLGHVGQRKRVTGMLRFVTDWLKREQRQAQVKGRVAVPDRPRWRCPHVEQCPHPAACAIAEQFPLKYPRRA